MSGEALPVICGAIKLVPIGFLPISAGPGITQAAMTCVREPGHPEPDADSSLHLCGTFAWKVGPGDDCRPAPTEAATSEEGRCTCPHGTESNLVCPVHIAPTEETQA